MPMGISTAPAWFQKTMEKVLHKHIQAGYCRVYLDDVIIFSLTLEDHYKHVDAILDTLIQTNFKTSFDESELITTSVTFLGNVISHLSIKPEPSRISALLHASLPVTIFDLQRWLGIFNFLIKRLHP
jgi:hypothetical protein